MGADVTPGQRNDARRQKAIACLLRAAEALTRTPVSVEETAEALVYAAHATLLLSQLETGERGLDRALEGLQAARDERAAL